LGLVESLKRAVASAQAGQTEGYFALLFFALGFVCLYSIFYQFRIRGWPTTTGQLLKAETEKLGFRDKNRPHETDYVNVVAYEYSVGGQSYISRRLSPWVVTVSHNLKILLERQLEDLQREQVVSVYYNPRKPSKSFLEKPGIVGLSITLLFTLGCFVTPVLIFS
jgi:hypothetical protein